LVFANTGTVNVTGGSLGLGYYASDSVTNGGTIEADGGTIYWGDNVSTATNLPSSTLTGGTWIAANGGTLSFEGTNPIVAIAPNTTLVLDAVGSTVRTRSGSGSSYQNVEQTLTTNNGTLKVLTNRNFSSTSSGVINNGTIQLGGGTFTASSLTNGAGSTLSGFGTFSPLGGIAIGNGVVVSPGSAHANSYVGTLAFNTATLGSGGAYTFDLMNASGTAGSGYDTLNVIGSLTITATPASPFTISVESINLGTGALGAASFNMAQSYQWTLLSAGSIGTIDATDFSINTSSFVNDFGIGSFFVSTNSNDLLLNFTPVPEPSTWALIAAGVAIVAFASWRRRVEGGIRRGHV
jgi:hypothetical protein